MVLAKQFLNELGVPDDKQCFIEKLDWERAHYSAQGYDQEIYLDRWGWTEVSGHNYRTDYDLKQHMKHSGVDMRIFKEYDKPTKTEEIIAESKAVSNWIRTGDVGEGGNEVKTIKVLNHHINHHETGALAKPHQLTVFPFSVCL